MGDDHGTGNWRNHLLIKCVNCKKPMGYHKFSTNKQCVECEIKVVPTPSKIK